MIKELEFWFTKCSDCLLHPEYIKLLDNLLDCELDQEMIEYLCDKTTSKKHWCEIRFEHLKILLLNKSALKFDLRQFYLDNLKKCRRLWLKMFFIRGYALYATEEELIPIVKKFEEQLSNNHDYIDYEHILSVAGLPYLVSTFGFDCLKKALEIAKKEYIKIDPRLRGYFTLDEHLEQVILLSDDEIKKRSKQILKNH